MSIAQVISAGLRQAQPTNSLFTCLACQVTFPTSERQRGHYRTDWHKYNLKRKVAELIPVSAEQFAQKVLAQQAAGRDEEERANLIYECGVCRRSYLSENSFSNHLKSKRHRELEFNSSKRLTTSITTSTTPVATNQKPSHRQQLFSDDEEFEVALGEQSNCGNDHVTSPPSDRSLILCLFCNHVADHFGANLHHMVKKHGFFLPDVEYLVDIHGLISYLFEKVVQDHVCLFCNDRGKQWRSLEAVRAHMVDKGHCKMAYDDSEDPDALLNFYDFGPIDVNALDSDDDVVLLNDNMEWLLDNGTKIGHRQRQHYFKRRLRRKTLDTKPILTIQDKEQIVADLVALANSEGNPLNRKQRRHLLTDHDVHNGGDPRSTLTIIQANHQTQKQYTRKSDFHHQVSIKNNKNTTRRLRSQVPV